MANKEFAEVKSLVNLPELETRVLDFWRDRKIFEASLAKESPQGKFVFLEGPPTANAKPGIHHVLARVFKDAIPRYKTMRGYHVERKAGWDTHGLPVEIEIEKKLGISGKQQIENIVPGDPVASIKKFNEMAKESVMQYKADWEKLTERVGFWLDMEHPYITYDSNYVESLWNIIKKINDKGLLEKGFKIMPYCPRCGTALSSHEVAQGYQEVEEKSVYIKFELVDEPGTYLLAWTTTPWTLPGNVALAVGSGMDYAEVEKDGEKLILAKELVSQVMGEDTKIIREISAQDLVGKHYKPLFDFIDLGKESGKDAYYVVSANFVGTTEGTGIVHIAPMYGEDDFKVGDEHDLPKIHTVSEDGKFLPVVSKWAGRSIVEGDHKDHNLEKEIVAELSGRGLLFSELAYTHDYPFCWRCGTPLLYYARPSWFVMMTRLREQLIANNELVNWVPANIKDGRFGEWLKEVKDWAFSRDRYWGTPLPVWVNIEDEKDIIVVGSFAELRELAKDASKVGTDFDPHRPFIDEIEIVKDGKTYKRVPEVADVWFDSGSASFAQCHYPFENAETIDSGSDFPVDYICEAIDQTRGWFYTLLAVSTILDKGPAYKNVVVLGHILDKNGKKMSKSKGNVIDPWVVADDTGIDALRWYFFSVNDPGLYTSFDLEGVKETVRKQFLTLWNSYSFFITYARIDQYQPQELPKKFSNVLDAWLIARLNETITKVTADLEGYDMMRATREINAFIDDLSNWYIRRSRRRFWKSESDIDKNEAYATLYRTLMTTAQLMAPFAPFMTEEIYQNLKLAGAPESIHLTDWPTAGEVDEKLITDMASVRDLVEQGLRLREEAKLKIRQPLASFTVDKELTPGLAEVLRDELNVKDVILGKSVSLDTQLTDELLAEGMMRETVRFIQELRKKTGLAVTDKIALQWQSDNEVIIKMWETYNQLIAKEVLAETITRADNISEGKILKLADSELIIDINGIH